MVVHGKKLISLTFGPLQNLFGPYQDTGLDQPLPETDKACQRRPLSYVGRLSRHHLSTSVVGRLIRLRVCQRSSFVGRQIRLTSVSGRLSSHISSDASTHRNGHRCIDVTVSMLFDDESCRRLFFLIHMYIR